MASPLHDLQSGVSNMDLNSDDNDYDNLNNNNDDEKELECHARMIAFFAHKGGVSKTTNVHHLAYILAQKFNFKVLMIDADPQCNLTQTCCRLSSHDASWRDNISRGTIFSSLERLHYGMKDGEYIDPANCINLHPNVLNQNKGTGELWLLPGSLDLAKLESQITFAHNITNPAVFPLFDDIAGGFRHLFISTCAHYDIDFCLIDMGPSIGELNKSLFWSCDYFIIPCSADAYCKTTIKTMQSTLPMWCEQQQRLASITADMTMPINADVPKFLGVIFSLFQTTGKYKKPIKDSLHWMDIIKQTVRDELVPSINTSYADMVHEYCDKNNYTLSEIPHFLSLMPIAQRSYCPIYDIPASGYSVQNADGDKVPMSKTEIDRHKNRASYFKDKYVNLAKTIIDMINAEESIDPVSPTK